MDKSDSFPGDSRPARDPSLSLGFYPISNPAGCLKAFETLAVINLSLFVRD